MSFKSGRKKIVKKSPVEKKDQRRSRRVEVASKRPWYDGSHEFVVDSRSALDEYVRFNPEIIQRIECSPKDYLTLHNRYSRSCPALLDRLVEDPTLKSVRATVALSSVSEAECLEQLSSNSKPCGILVLDHLEDPQNVGAIIRSAAFFGIRWIVMPKVRQSGLHQSTVAIAQGAFSLVSVVAVANIARFCEKLKKAEIWVLGADMAGDPVLSSKGQSFERKALVLGNEQKGLSHIVRRSCDSMVSVSTRAENHLESLNVSVATGILLSHLYG